MVFSGERKPNLPSDFSGIVVYSDASRLFEKVELSEMIALPFLLGG